MNGNRVLKLESSGSSQRGHSSMASTLTDCRGARPDNLLPGVRKFPDQERANMWSPCSNCSSSDENNSPTALNRFNWDKPALEDKSVDFSWVSSESSSNGKNLHSKTTGRRKIDPRTEKKSGSYVNLQHPHAKYSNDCTTSEPRKSPKKDRQSTQGCGSLTEPSQSENLYPLVDLREERSEQKEDPPSSSDADFNERSEEDIEKEKEDLRNVAWFQAGIPREIALEVLAEKPEGSFIVRKSTTKLGCYALSLRVPQEKNPTGIAHYLILQTNKGYKIKGFTKEFSSLNALITHHSVMPELLPCPLNLSRQFKRDAEHEFEETEQKTCDIFSDIHWLMTDLEV
ncbi:Tensin-3 like protein [Argiope bruennichi]|uniref:Tensin-3 like protein n=1 Tax=Argiope bruennichi TaxID=94029 RepID=A0A8T0EI49_ARGBR|nr:Tensin-3 like protein [Argiope bruennichi]